MKFCSALLALCAIQGASGFATPKPMRQNTAVAASYQDYMGTLGAAPGPVGSGTTAPSGYSPSAGAMQSSSDMARAKDVWSELNPITVQGGSLRTWSFTTTAVERVQVMMRTEGRPLNCNLELWQGPDNTPQRIGIYVEDGNLRPFSCVIDTPKVMGNAVAIYNTGHLEYPLSAHVEAELEGASQGGTTGIGGVVRRLEDMSSPMVIQGGAIRSYPFDPSVASVQVLMKTDGRPLNGRIELLQGPNNSKQVMEVYTEDGMDRPFFAVIETPGAGNVIRIVNTAPVEFPLAANVEPYLVDESESDVLQGAAPVFIVDGPSARGIY